MQELEQIDAVIAGPLPHSGLRTATAGNLVSRKVLHCEVVADFSRLESLASEWDRLWESDCGAEIFQTLGWAKAWWRSYGDQFTLCSLLVYEGDALLGIVPLVKQKSVIQFLGTPQADYADIVCEDCRAVEVLTVALDALLSWGQGWNECLFQHLSKDSRIVRHYQELPRKLRRRMQVVPTAPYQTIVLGENREEVFKSFQGKNHTRRRQNKLHKAGRVQFRYMETRAEAQEYLSDFFRQHIRRRAVIGKESACAIPEFRNFLRALVDEIEPNGRLRFGVLELDGRALAWGLGFHVNGKFLLYQHTFDLDAWDYSPGEVLLWHLLEYARGNVTREFDFGKGEEAYKNRFTNYARETFSLFVERQGVAGAIRGWLRKAEGSLSLAASNLKRIVQEYRPAMSAFRAIQTWSKETLRAARQARKSGALLKYVGDLAARLFRTVCRGKETVEVFVSDTSGESNTQDSVAAGPGEEVSVSVGSLGDLVDVALQCPDILALSELPQCRQRLKRGDRVYIVREKSEPALLSWMVTDAQFPPVQDGNPSMLIEECIAASHLQNSTWYSLLLSSLKYEASCKKLALAIQCRQDQPVLRSELQRQGFLSRGQMARYKGLA